MRWWLLFAGIVLGLGYALLAYGWLPTLIGTAITGLVVLLALGLGRAAKRGDLVDPDREEQPLDTDADRPDTNGEPR